MMLGCKWSKEYHIFYFQDYVWIAFFISQTKLILNLVMTICTSRDKYSTSCIVTQTVDWHSCLNFKYLQLVAPQMTCIQQPIHLMPDQQFQELEEKEKIKGYWLILYQILWTNTIKIIWQRVKKLLKSFTEIKARHHVWGITQLQCRSINRRPPSSFLHHSKILWGFFDSLMVHI